jgi:hypothetical protein
LQYSNSNTERITKLEIDKVARIDLCFSIIFRKITEDLTKREQKTEVPES